MNRTDRLYALVEELRAIAPRRRSARWLADRFEVSMRTVERDISALQGAGVPIWAEPGRNGGYAIDTKHTLPPLGLTVDEALAVTIGLGGLARSPFRGAAASALQKLLAVMDDDDVKRSTRLANRIHLLEDDSRADVPTALADVLRADSVVRIRYRDGGDRVTVREIEPLGYIGRGQDWYLVAWCRLREGVRAFRGDRVLEATLTGERPPPRVVQREDLDIPFGELRPIASETPPIRAHRETPT